MKKSFCALIVFCSVSAAYCFQTNNDLSEFEVNGELKESKAKQKADDKALQEKLCDKPCPEFTLTDTGGKLWTDQNIKGKVTMINIWHAAQGYARVSGKVGVCVVTSGPGATNAITGIGDAMLDSTPLVVIAGQVGAALLGTDAFQEIDLVSLTQPITKWSYQIRRGEDIAWAVARAFYIAKSGRPGPVVLDFAKNAQLAKIEYVPHTIDFIRSYQPVVDIDEEAVCAAAQLINFAKKPLALVGQGVELGGAQKELLEFLEKADIPAGKTLLGLSALQTNHPLNKGMLGMHAVAKHSAERMSQQLLVSYGGQALGALLSKKSAATQTLAGQVFGLGANYAVMLPYSRSNENEADRMGLIFAAMAGYDPQVAVEFWQRMSQGGTSIPAFFSTHPSDAARIANIKKVMPEALKYYKK